MVAAASWIAGHPVTVACDVDVNPSPFPIAAGFVATAWTLTGGSVIHATSTVCDETSAQVGTMAFADGIATMIHEGARAHGWQSDSCVELLADIGVFDVLQRFYGVPLFSSTSELVGAEVLGLTRARPTSFQPESCWASGRFS